MDVLRLDHLVLTVASFERAREFYESALGMRYQVFTGADGAERAALHFGEQKINLHAAGREFAPHAKAPSPGSADLCLIVSGALEDWVARLVGAGVPIEEGPVARTGAIGPIRSIYCRDPDGNLIELSIYEAD